MPHTSHFSWHRLRFLHEVYITTVGGQLQSMIREYQCDFIYLNHITAAVVLRTKRQLVRRSFVIEKLVFENFFNTKLAQRKDRCKTR